MKKRTREEIAALEDQIVSAVAGKGEPDRAKIWRWVVLRDGPKAAAWLVWSQRAALRRTGMVDLVLRRGEAMPSWCRAAFDCLVGRPGWEIVEVPRIDGGRVHRIVRVPRAARRRRAAELVLN